MTTLYWIFEYMKVFLAYMFVMYVWPLTVFRGFLKNKSRTFRFAFCVTVQVILINDAVLFLGLFHLLNAWVVRLLFYGSFLFSILRRISFGEKEINTFKHLISGTYGLKLFIYNTVGWAVRFVKNEISKLIKRLYGFKLEYMLLSVIIIFGMVYFSFGAFQDYSYGFGDMYPHHAWIYALTQGQIFYDGVYPEAMHVMIYAVHTLFGVRIYSILLFLAGIHVSVFLLSAYVLMREIFRWRLTPHLVLAGFLTIDVMCVDAVYSMSRLQWTIPQEYALYTQFLCAAFLIKYLRCEKHIIIKRKVFKYLKSRLAIAKNHVLHKEVPGTILPELKKVTSKGYWDENLLVFMLALASSLAIHFYVTIMAFFLCLSFVPFMLRRIFNRKRFAPLIAAVVCGFALAVVPMVGALISGIPFQGSIGWAMSVINGTENEGADVDEGIVETESGNSDGDTAQSAANADGNTDTPADVNGAADESIGNDGNSGTEAVHKPSLTDRLKAYIVSLPERIYGVYLECYVTLYGIERADFIIFMLVLTAALWFLYRVIASLLHFIPAFKKINPGYFDRYPSLILASVIFMIMYWPVTMGLPSLVAGSRLCSTEQMLNIAMIAIPVDMLMSLAAFILPRFVAKAAAVLAVFGIYIGTMLTGTFHGYLYYELTRYNGAVMTTYSITDNLPKGSFTIVSPVDETYQIVGYGWHEELVSFINQSANSEYTLPSEYVFIYVEKKPIEYAQSHFFTGPKWLAWEKYPKYYSSYVSQCPDITHSEISEELVAGRLARFPVSSRSYSELDTRTILESTVYQWCQDFDKIYPHELRVYYEDDDFICYYFKQNTQRLYRLGIR